MRLFFLFIVAIFIISACSAPQPTVMVTPPDGNQDPGPTQPAEITPGYPAPLQDATPDSSYPAPPVYTGPGYPEPDIAATQAAGLAAQVELPEQDPDLGSVTGVLLTNNTPVVNATLYLAEVLKDDQGRESVASFDRVNSPRTFTDAQGRFRFVNVPPGRYGLVLDKILDSYLLNDPETGGQFLITVEVGQEADLGELDHEDLPVN